MRSLSTPRYRSEVIRFESLIGRLLFIERKQPNKPAAVCTVGIIGAPRRNGSPHGSTHHRWETFPYVVVVVHGQAQLLQPIRALHSSCGLAGRLNRRQEKCHQDPNNGNHHQQFDQGEGLTPSSSYFHGNLPKKWKWGIKKSNSSPHHIRNGPVITGEEVSAKANLTKNIECPTSATKRILGFLTKRTTQKKYSC